MSSEESELIQMAGDGSVKKRNGQCCCVGVCSVLLVIALLVCAATPPLYVEVIQPYYNQMIDEVRIDCSPPLYNPAHPLCRTFC